MPETNAKRKEYACTCVVCGKAFTAGSPRAKYCSDKCRNEARRERERIKREAEKIRDAKDAGQATGAALTAPETLTTGEPKDNALPAAQAPESEITASESNDAPSDTWEYGQWAPADSAPLFPGVMPEPPHETEHAALRMPETAVPTPEETAMPRNTVPAQQRPEDAAVFREKERPAAPKNNAQTERAFSRKPIPKERLTGFVKAEGRQKKYVRAAAMDEFKHRAAAWGSLLIFGCALIAGTLIAWPDIDLKSRILCAGLSAAPCLIGAAGIVMNRTYRNRVVHGRFKILPCEVTKYFAFTKPEARDVLIRTEKGQYCKDAFRVDMSGHDGDDVILVRCVVRGRPAFVLIKPED